MMRLALLILNGFITFMLILMCERMKGWGLIGWFLLFGTITMDFFYILGSE